MDQSNMPPLVLYSFAKFRSVAILHARINWQLPEFSPTSFPEKLLTRPNYVMIAYSRFARKVEVAGWLHIPERFRQVMDFVKYTMPKEQLLMGNKYTSSDVLILRESDFHQLINMQ